MQTRERGPPSALAKLFWQTKSVRIELGWMFVFLFGQHYPAQTSALARKEFKKKKYVENSVFQCSVFDSTNKLVSYAL